MAILVASRLDDIERPRVHQLQKPSLSLLAKFQFGRALRAVYFGRVDVREPDLHPAIMDGVTINDAIRLDRSPAKSEGAASRDAAGKMIEDE